MNKLVTIKEAIDILQKLEESGEQVVLMSNIEIETGISFAAIPISINRGIMVIENSKHPISYVEDRIMRSLKTQTDLRNISTLIFK